MLAIFLSYLLIYKYLILFLVTYSAALIFPIPASAVLIAAGAFASQGYFSFEYVILFGLLGNVLGDLCGYFISYYFGREFLMRIGLKKFLSSKTFVKLEHNFVDHAWSSIFFSRFVVTGLGSAVNILSGITKIPFKKYFLYEFTGEVIYVLMLSSLGYIFGVEWKSIYGIVEDLSGLIIIILIIVIAAIYYFKRKHKNKSEIL